MSRECDYATFAKFQKKLVTEINSLRGLSGENIKALAEANKLHMAVSHAMDRLMREMYPGVDPCSPEAADIRRRLGSQ